MTLKQKGPVEGPDEKLPLSGDMLRLQTELQKIVKQKMDTGSVAAAAILAHIDKI